MSDLISSVLGCFASIFDGSMRSTEGTKERQIFDNSKLFFDLGFDGYPGYTRSDWKIDVWKDMELKTFCEKNDPGVYYLSLVPDDIELWFAQSCGYDTHTITPYVRSKYPNSFRLVERTKYPYTIFKGQFKVVSQMPGSKGLSLIFDCPNYLLCERNPLSSIYNIELTLFSSSIDIIDLPTEDHKYFIEPLLDDTMTVKHRSHGSICYTVLIKSYINMLGVVKEVKQHTNAALGTHFYTIVVEAMGISITVIQNAASKNKIPEVNDVVRAYGWLMGTFEGV